MLVSSANQQDVPDPNDPALTENGAVGFLILSEDPEEWKALVKGASSFSCAVGNPVWLAPYLSILQETRREERPMMYACENNHKAVRELKVRGTRDGGHFAFVPGTFV